MQTKNVTKRPLTILSLFQPSKSITPALSKNVHHDFKHKLILFSPLEPTGMAMLTIISQKIYSSSVSEETKGSE